MTPRTVVVLGKAPEPGRVKTRMVRGGLSPEQAAAVQRACMLDVLARSYGAVRRVLHAKGADEASIWSTARTLGWTLRSQLHEDLGRNLVDATNQVGGGPMLVLGTDSPDVPDEIIDAAWEALQRTDVVLGPSFDGGYYLVALSRPIDALFSGIRWGGADVFEATVSIASSLGLTVTTLPFWYDLDEVADLRRLRLHSQRTGAGAVPYPTPHLHHLFRTDPSILDGHVLSKGAQE